MTQVAPNDGAAVAMQAELRSLTRRAFVLRGVVAIAVHFGLGEFALAPDQETYDYVGNAVAQYWRGDTYFLTGFVQNPRDPLAYFYIVAALYYLFGSWSLLPKLVNCFVGALTVPLAHGIALGVSGDPKVALRTARYTAYFPSLVLWSSLNLRDVWTACLILLVCRLAIGLQDSPGVIKLAMLGGAIYLLTQFRGYIFFPIMIPIVLSFFVRGRRNLARNLLIGGLVGIAVLYVDSTSSERRFRMPDLETLQELRYFTSLGGQQYEARADISTPIKAALFLPKGVAFFLLAPFPWEVRNLVQASTVPEMLFFYGLLPAVLIGLRHLIRTRLSDALMMLLMLSALTFGYALGQSNVGTAYRHRAQVLPFYLMLAATGIQKRYGFSRTPAPVPAPAQSVTA